MFRAIALFVSYTAVRVSPSVEQVVNFPEPGRSTDYRLPVQHARILGFGLRISGLAIFNHYVEAGSFI